uniref:N-terminal acetyltransferase B complex subunit MDM20 homolog n=1 Tax=Neobodo designis TaxID=312471 RepID=A0A7S1PK66_NEODS|mmetsp:Transcript_11248/g.34936  ORF Transcript_11248/g.34936 Transcript_11248/m.34936 type:complete len:891 (+) Transcript_11248:43-2715(+)
MAKRQTADDAAAKAMDHLDRRDVSAAEVVLEPWLAKEPQHHALRAANALLLLTKNETEDAIEEALALERDEPVDPKAVNACVHVLQRTCQWDAVVRLYQRVIPILSKGSPDRSASENLALTFARMHRYPEMQKECAKLAKDSGEAQYTVWGTMANLLAVPAGDSNSILLKLAARVVDKQILDSPAIKVTPEHCAMYLEALERQNAFDDALKFIASKRFRALGPADRLHQYARVAQRAGDAVLAAAIGRHLWALEPENWTFFTMVADGIANASPEGLRETKTVTFEDAEPLEVRVLNDGEATALDVLASIQKALPDPNAPPRGLLLEKMELLFRTGAAPADLKTLVRDFCVRNGPRPSCFLDVVKYIPVGSDVAWLTDIGGDAAESLDDHRRVTLRLQLTGAIDRSISTSDEATIAHLKSVLAALDKCPKPAELGDSAHPWAQLLSTACNAIGRRIHALKGDDTARRAWAALGARVVAVGPEKHKFPMVHLFGVLFAQILGYHDIAAVDALDFKSVQLDSMAFFCLAEVRESHDMVRAFHYAAHAHQWYGRFESDTSALVAKTFQNCAWTQISQLRQFQQAIANSVSRAEWYALYAALSTLSSENQATLIAEVRRLRLLVQVLRVDSKDAVANDDRSSVAAAAFLELPNSDLQKELLDSLLPPTSTPAQRSAEAHGICAFFLCLRDLALFVVRATAPKPSKADKKAKKAAAQTPQQPLQLLMDDAELGLESRVARSSCASTAVPIVALVRSIVKGDGTAGKAELAAVEAALDAYATRAENDDANALRPCLWPELPVVVSALRLLAPVATKAGVPVKAWAGRVSKALHKAEDVCTAAAASAPVFGDAPLVEQLSLTPAGETVTGNLHRATFEKLAHALKAATMELDALTNMK